MQRHIMLLIAILTLSASLLFYRLNDLMIFIGDQGWFYLSARDMVLNGEVPLVGITSSHTWLHQGALWTYMLALIFKFFGFNPVNGAYLSITFTLISILFLYKIGRAMFSERIGLIAAFLYATSPLIIAHGRMPYHTNPIALLTTLLLLFTYRWMQGNIRYFPMVILTLTLLYNFELATFTLVPIIIVLLIFGFIKHKIWVRGLVNKKTIFLSIIAFIIPMIPMIIYDIGHGFPQTLKFLIWVIYKIAVTLNLYSPLHPNAPGETYLTMFTFATMLLQRLIFIKSALISWILLLSSFSYLVYVCLKSLRMKITINSYLLLLLFFIVPLAGYISAKTNSEAYLIIFFPSITLMLAVLFDKLISIKTLFFLSTIVTVTIGGLNINLLINQNYLMGNPGYGHTLKERQEAAKKITSLAKGNSYNLIGNGDGSQYESYTMNYEYLTFLLGHPPSEEESATKIVISDDEDQILVKFQSFK